MGFAGLCVMCHLAMNRVHEQVVKAWRLFATGDTMSTSRRKRKRERCRAQQGHGQRGDRTETPGNPFLAGGVLGDSVAAPGRGNLRFILKAVRHGWPIPPEKRLALVRHIDGVLRGCRDVRCVLAVARIVLAMDRANLCDVQNLRDHRA